MTEDVAADDEVRVLIVDSSDPEFVIAATAGTWGYVDRALPADELRRFVDTLAARIASCPLEAISCAKRAVEAGARTRYFELGERL